MAELKNKPNTLGRDDFVSLFGGVYEHSPWVAEQVFDAGLDESFNDADVLAAAMAKVVARQDKQTKLDLSYAGNW